MLKVMIVDDDPYVIITIRELFEPEGFQVYACSSGKECIDELERGFKGVILMDVMMPYMDGWDTVSEIVSKGFDKDNIISMLSAKDAPKERTGYEEYVRDYLKKPFKADELISTIKGYFK